jgi:hypothetical protein
VVGCCRHFATLATALLRLRGIPARARCGFGTYFVEGRNVDHWIIEHWNAEEDRWVRIDVEHLDRSWPAKLDDLQAGEFLTGGEAWTWYRTGEVDGNLFGVAGVDFAWGPGEIRGNAIRDLASLNKLEMLPWDEWSRMAESYAGKTGADYDELMDELAAITAGDDAPALARLYAASAKLFARHTTSRTGASGRLSIRRSAMGGAVVPAVSWEHALAWRMQQHHLVERAEPAELVRIVSDICGLHAQVMSSAELSVWARSEGLRRGAVQESLWRRRDLVKLWGARGTLYLLPATEGASGCQPSEPCRSSGTPESPTSSPWPSVMHSRAGS